MADRRSLLLAVPALICATSPAAPFLPRSEVPYRYTLEQVRTVGGNTYRAGFVRRITFHKEADGWTAEFFTIEVDKGDGSAAVTALERVFAGHIGAITKVRLDLHGNVLAVDHPDAIWSAFIADARALGGKQLAAAIAAVPAGERARMIASPLADIIATTDAAKPAGTRAVTVPGIIPGGTPIALAGNETVTADGPVHIITTSASAEAEAPFPAQTGSDEPSVRHSIIRFARSRKIDEQTGLASSTTETQHTTIGTGSSADNITTETRIDLTPW